MYDFAVNKLKLQRAIAELNAEAVEADKKNYSPTEEEVKERYVKLQGMLVAEEEVKTAAPRAAMKAKPFKKK